MQQTGEKKTKISTRVKQAKNLKIFSFLQIRRKQQEQQ